MVHQVQMVIKVRKVKLVLVDLVVLKVKKVKRVVLEHKILEHLQVVEHTLQLAERRI